MLLVFACTVGLHAGLVSAQVDSLPPPGEEADFTFDSITEVGDAPPVGGFKGRDRDPKISVTWSPLSGQPDVAVLAIRVELQDGANTYSLDAVDGFRKPTKITVTSLDGLTAIDEKFVADHAPKIAADPNFDGLLLQKYFHEVTFLRRYQISGDAPPSAEGKIDLLVCRNTCTPHNKKSIVAEWSTDPYDGPQPESWKAASRSDDPTSVPPVDSKPPTEQSPSASSEAPPGQSESGGSAIEVEKSAPLSFGYALGLAFLGGLIMNVMPCVLPVIAIKVVSFVQQAGESRSRIFALNLTYSLGVIVVFLGLATLATFAKIGLGQLFQHDGFNVVMACVVFAMGLSLLGVFEFRLPGTVGGSTEHEGLPGAFFTGVLATLLATPCIGPFVSGVLVWSVTQPTAVIYLIWATLGLGMASPYLLIGLFPQLVDQMPRPGMWMVRFKEFSGFVLMATVIFLINSVSPGLLIPTLVILLGIALALWMIGNLYDHSTPAGQKWKVRLAAALISLPLIGWGTVQHVGVENVYAFLHLSPESKELPWQPFTQQKLVELRKSGQPILIDFTADWCLICKANERMALNTKATAEFVKTHQIVCLKADYTDESEEIKTWLDRFGAAGVPLTVIFPPGEKAKGVLFDGAFTQSKLLQKMEQAWMKSQTSMTTKAQPHPDEIGEQTVLR